MATTILIVDDSISMRQMVNFVLTASGYSVVQAVHGKDALDKLNNGAKIDMVITDLNMPEMDGIEFIKQFRRHPSYKFTPVVMLTTESKDSKKQDGKQAGASGWIVKPFTPEQLLDVVKKFARR
ncbi:MAG: response regulator [Deltaproteobacteria bacterium]|nr:response regulator [Deltaproteobacteria bacterium]